MLKMCLYYNKKSKQVEPAFCKKPWLKAVHLNLGEGTASSRGLLYLLMQGQMYFCCGTWVVPLLSVISKGFC